MFFVLVPMEVLFLGALVWIPLLIWRERVRASRYGFLPGAIARFCVVAALISTASLLPTKHEDGRVGPLPRPESSFGELVAAGVIYPLFDDQHDDMRFTLPSTTPTRREVMHAITQQTGFRTSVGRCGSGATVLFGSGGGRIKISKSQDRRREVMPAATPSNDRSQSVKREPTPTPSGKLGR